MNNKLMDKPYDSAAKRSKHPHETGELRKNNTEIFNCGPDKSKAENTITIFGHVFTMSELNTLSTFSGKLQATASTLLNSGQSVPEGSIFILKVIDHEINVSFGGFLKK
jgi:hypothetical protein